MSSVERYVSTHVLPSASEWNVSAATHTYVKADDYAALAAECRRLREALEEIARSETYVGDVARAALAGSKEGQ